MIGAGSSRAGFGPAGLPDNETATVMRTSGDLSRRLDPARGDYADPRSNGRIDFGGMPSVVAEALVAVGNKVGSFAWDPTRGDPSLSIDRDDGKVPQRALAYTRAQLEPLIAAGRLQLLGVESVVVQGAWSRTIRIVDLTTGKEHTL